MGDLARRHRGRRAATAATRPQLSRDWEIWGPNGGYIASIALRAAGAHSRFGRPVSIVGHFLGVADVRRRRSSRSRRCGGEAGGVDPRLDHAEPASRSSTRWCGRSATSTGSSTTLASMPGDVRARVGAVDRGAARRGGRPSRCYRFWENFDERSESWVDDWENWLERTPAYPSFERWYRYLPTLDVRRPRGSTRAAR